MICAGHLHQTGRGMDWLKLDTNTFAAKASHSSNKN